MDDASDLNPGTPAIQAMDGQFKNTEWLNLDGIPEGEALKLVGVDAGGHDIKAGQAP